MKFTAPREKILNPLQNVIGVVERRQTMPVLSNVMLATRSNRLSITGTDLGGAFSVTAAGTDADGVIVSITFKRAFSVAPRAIVISPINKRRQR